MTDREKVIKGLEQFIADFKPYCGNEADWQRVYDAIALLKAQEVVVRCKDCIYWKSNLLTHFWKPCDVVSTDKDWYCPCGKQM